MIEVINIRDYGKYEIDSLRFICRESSVPPQFRGKTQDLSILGNPFTIGSDGDRDEVIEQYRIYAENRVKTDDGFAMAVMSCRDKVLVCFCKPQACHGDVLKSMVESQTSDLGQEILGVPPKETCICFTGHRPSKLYGYDWSSSGNKLLMTKLEELIKLILTKFSQCRFICGGAIGTDQMACSLCLKLRDEFPQTIVQLALPFSKQDSLWKDTDKARWRSHIINANSTVMVDTVRGYELGMVEVGEYHPAKMQKRNEYMVDKAEIVIAVWDGSHGGTYNCIKYAQKRGKRIIVLNTRTFKYGWLKGGE